jgi:hypothetical protein
MMKKYPTYIYEQLIGLAENNSQYDPSGWYSNNYGDPYPSVSVNGEGFEMDPHKLWVAEAHWIKIMLNKGVNPAEIRQYIETATMTFCFKEIYFDLWKYTEIQQRRGGDKND